LIRSTDPHELEPNKEKLSAELHRSHRDSPKKFCSANLDVYRRELFSLFCEDSPLKKAKDVSAHFELAFARKLVIIELGSI
jgi:hypothetical protein